MSRLGPAYAYAFNRLFVLIPGNFLVLGWSFVDLFLRANHVFHDRFLALSLKRCFVFIVVFDRAVILSGTFDLSRAFNLS
jgi:hypothetical protein